MRYAYIKNGDAIEQVERLLKLPTYPKGGPDAFIGDLLQLVDDDPILILSCAGTSHSYTKGNLVAQVYNWKADSLGRVVAAFKRLLSTLSGGMKIIKFHPDVIICGRTGGFLWMSYIAAKFLRVLIIHSRHNRVYWPKRSLVKRISEYIDIFVIRRVQAALVHGPYLYQQMKDINVDEKRIFEFDQGIDNFIIDLDSTDAKSNEPDDDLPTILFVGRIEREKGIFDLLEAVSRLIDSGLQVRLVYVGRGAHVEEIRQKVVELNLTRVVDVKGAVNHTQLPQIMKNSTVIVTPTRSSFPEGRCMVIMEAFAVGIPVVGPDTGPFPYLIESGVNGLLFESDSVSSLSDALKLLLLDKALLNNLSKGAKNTGQKLIQENISFGQALSSALLLVNERPN